MGKPSNRLLKYEIKCDLYKIAQKNKNLQFGLLNLKARFFKPIVLLLHISPRTDRYNRESLMSWCWCVFLRHIRRYVA